MNVKIFFWTTFLELFEIYPKKSLNLASIQGPSCKYSSCAGLGPFHLAGREPACHESISLSLIGRGQMGCTSWLLSRCGASAQCFWIHWLSCNLTCMPRYDIQPHHFSVVSVECYFFQLILFFQVEHIAFQSHVWKNNVSLKFDRVSKVLSFFKLWDKLDKLEICNGQILKTHFLLKQMKSGPRLRKICKLWWMIMLGKVAAQNSSFLPLKKNNPKPICNIFHVLFSLQPQKKKKNLRSSVSQIFKVSQGDFVMN